MGLREWGGTCSLPEGGVASNVVASRTASFEFFSTPSVRLQRSKAPCTCRPSIRKLTLSVFVTNPSTVSTLERKRVPRDESAEADTAGQAVCYIRVRREDAVCYFRERRGDAVLS